MTPSPASRRAHVERQTTETQISIDWSLDGSGRGHIQTTIPFLDHMLQLLSKHGFFDLTIQAKGDTDIDDHHTVEDVGIVLGDALKQALGDKAGTAISMSERITLLGTDKSRSADSRTWGAASRVNGGTTTVWIWRASPAGDVTVVIFVGPHPATTEHAAAIARTGTSLCMPNATPQNF